MTNEILIRYLHFISMFGVSATLVGQHLLMKKEMTRSEIYRLSIIDSIYGLSAITLVGAGLSLWFWVGKPTDFYMHNWIFMLKLSLAVLLGLSSLPPTIFFSKNRKKKDQLDEIVVIPKYVIILLRIELMLLLIIPLCAVLMAKGIGYIGQ